MQNVIYIQGVDCSSLDTRNICCALDYLAVSFCCYEQCFTSCIQSVQHIYNGLCLELVASQAIQNDQIAILYLSGQSRLHTQFPNLLI